MVCWLWEKTPVGEVVSSNPSTGWYIGRWLHADWGGGSEESVVGIYYLHKQSIYLSI